MGNKDTASKRPVVEGQDISSVAKYLSSGKCKNVFFMLGAGVSTSAGIPDFRSPETGLYANLARLNLPFPEAVFEINFFRRNPVPFYTLAQELYPGRFRPTPTHSFIRLLSERSLLHTCFTQNIDTLERRAGVPAEKIVEAHGSFATQRCIDCHHPYDGEKMKKIVMDKAIPKCTKCFGLVKPDIVFFGEALPTSFRVSVPSLRYADLLIVIGTSLTVHPFASLVELVPSACPRVLINIDHVGNIGSRRNDVVCLGKCDDIVKELCRELGWEEELERLWKTTEGSIEKGVLGGEVEGESEEEKLENEVDKLASEVEASLALGAVEGTDPSIDTFPSPPDAFDDNGEKLKDSISDGKGIVDKEVKVDAEKKTEENGETKAGSGAVPTVTATDGKL